MNLDGIERYYIVYVPEKYNADLPVPLMFNFHGFTMSANDQMTLCDMRSIADTAGFILVYPQGTLFFGAPHWNVGSWTSASTADDIGFTTAMIDTISSEYNINLDRVYSSGFSNGGYFSFELACKLSDRIAAIGTVGGTMSNETYDACDPEHPIPVVTIHGTIDGTVSYDGGAPFNSKSQDEVIDFWSDFNDTEVVAIESELNDLDTDDGSTVTLFDYQMGEACSSVQHYRVDGGDHDWPGSWGNMDIDASEVIWNFVSQYDINGLISCGISSSNDLGGFADEIEVYPNPTNGEFSVQIELNDPKTYTILSTMGESLKSGLISTGNQTINISDFPSGLYYLKIDNSVAKIVKSN